MTLRSRLLAAALLVTASCSLDLAKYEPKADADCDYGMKACGYRCVPNDNPATGCWEVENVCNPCPTGGAHTVPACETVTYGWPVCTLVCEAGWGDCNTTASDGCETDLSISTTHCGACGHACATCTGGLCPTAPVGTISPATPVDLDLAGGTLFSVDSGGALRSVASPVTPLLTGLGTVRRLRMVSATEGWVSGTDAANGNKGTLWKVTQPSSWGSASWADTTGAVADFALVRDAGGAIAWVAWSPTDATGYKVVNPTDKANKESRDWSHFFTALEADPSVPPFYEVYAGTADGSLLSYVPSSGGGFGGVAAPTRLAVFLGSDGYVTLFSASASDGSVTIAQGSVDRIIPGAGPTTAIDIHADAAGVYWCDATAGVVRAWRASDGFVFDLARGGQPVAVTSDATVVIWANADGTVRSVAK